jgi:hypothetical protein
VATAAAEWFAPALRCQKYALSESPFFGCNITRDDLTAPVRTLVLKFRTNVAPSALACCPCSFRQSEQVGMAVEELL